MRPAAAIVLAIATLTASALAGCVGGPGGDDAIVVTRTPEPERAQVVVGVVDDAPNPYHVAFRATGPDAYRHPSTYLPGFPATAARLDLTLNASTLDEALAADADVWERVEPERLYWIPGTRIVAFYPTEPVTELDPAGFGTTAAGRAVGNGTSLAPDAKLAVFTLDADAKAIAYATAQEWLDVLLIGWNVGFPTAVSRAVSGPLQEFASTRPLVVAAGDGLAVAGAPPLLDGQAVGVAGRPAFSDGAAGVPGAITVGGHDNGRPTPWTGTVPHVVADTWAAPVPDARSLDGLAEGHGTTASAGWVAGAAARLLLDARTLLDDKRIGVVDGTLAEGTPTASGPLADGNLTLAELRDALVRTADPDVATTDADGAAWDGDVGQGVKPSLPVAYADLPPAAARYVLVGYGAVTAATVEAAWSVLAGEAASPERAEDAFAERDAEVRGLMAGS